MPRLPEEFIRRIRETTDIVALFRTYADVKRRGRTYVCCCPFHSEKTPSCTIYPDDQSFYCFGCGTGGTAITFVQKMENLPFLEAVRTLAQRSGIQMPAQDPEEERLAHLRRRCYEINRETANFYYSNLLRGKDRAGLAYFRSRKILPETIQKYGLGFAPDSWGQLTDHLKHLGYAEEEMVAAGVCRRSEKGNVYDNFRNRVIFPIVDIRGNVIGFGGRVLDDSKPKYLNTADTPVFDKGANLFSLHFAKDAASSSFILAEGYMDVIAVNQAGFPNVVATLGTAITPAQARRIAQYAKEVIIAYDSDGAGQTATQRALQRFGEVGLPTRILHMEGAKDPDEYIKTFGADAFRRLLDDAGDAIHFQIDKCRDGLHLQEDMDKTKYLDRVKHVLADIADPLQREVYISRVAAETDIRSETLRKAVDDTVKQHKGFAKKARFQAIEAQSLQRDELEPMAVQYPRESRAEQMILAYLLLRPEDWEMVWGMLRPEGFVTNFHRRVYEAICTHLAETGQTDLTFLSEEFSVEEMGRITGIAARSREIPPDRDALEECIEVLREGHDRVVPGTEMTDDDLLRVVADQQRRNSAAQ